MARRRRNSTINALTIVLAAILVGSWSYCRGNKSDNESHGNAIEQTDQRETEETGDGTFDTDTLTNENAGNDDAEVASASPANPVCGLPETGNGVREILLRRYAYTCSFNPDTKIPNWVAWELTAEHTNGPYKRGGIQFQEDEGVTTQDYVRSGYDRGHMCPSGDNKWNETAQEQSFLMTNICPQNHNLNAGDWNEMEMQCRRWAERFGSIDIIAGPILFRSKHKRIGRGVTVPEAFFKVVYCPSKQMAIGFIYRNEEGNRPKGDYVNSVAQIERITGFRFLTALPEAKAKKIKEEANLDDWY